MGVRSYENLRPPAFAGMANAVFMEKYQEDRTG
jgi:hypothetical protein